MEPLLVYIFWKGYSTYSTSKPKAGHDPASFYSSRPKTSVIVIWSLSLEYAARAFYVVVLGLNRFSLSGWQAVVILHPTVLNTSGPLYWQHLGFPCPLWDHKGAHICQHTLYAKKTRKRNGNSAATIRRKTLHFGIWYETEKVWKYQSTLVLTEQGTKITGRKECVNECVYLLRCLWVKTQNQQT